MSQNLGKISEYGIIVSIIISLYYFSSLTTAIKAQQNQEMPINWLELCENPLVDAIIAEPCRTLTTPDGFTLTQEGERVLGCLSGGTLAFLAGMPELATMGELFGCGEGSTSTIEPDSSNVITDSNNDIQSSTDVNSWKYFVRDGLSYIMIPSDWHNVPVNESEKSTPFEYHFIYAGEYGEYAGVLLFINKSGIYSNSTEMAKAILSQNQQKNSFSILKPLNCDLYTLNDEPACSLSLTGVVDGVRTNFLVVSSVNSHGMDIAVMFIATNNIYDSLLSKAKQVINSIEIDSDRINEVFGIAETNNIQSEIPPIPQIQTNDTEVLVPENQTDTKKQLPGFEISEF